MRVLIAGATGAIGAPLVRELSRRAVSVVGMVRSDEERQALAAAGAEAVMADARDAAAVMEAVRHTRPEAIVNELTALPKHYTPAEMRRSAERDRATRLEGHQHLLAAARASGVRRYVLQSCGFWYAPGAGLADEATPFATEASPGIAAGVRTYERLEAALEATPELEGVVLRYGFLYGGTTWYTRDGDMAQQARLGQVPVIGEGQGVWSFVHVDDAADATVAALQGAPGVYNVVDDDAAEQSRWLPAFAHWVGGPEPPRVSEQAALETVGPDAVYYATRLRGAANDKAKAELGFKPRRLEWLEMDAAPRRVA